jgi:hypothetical protein
VLYSCSHGAFSISFALIRTIRVIGFNEQETCVV